MRYCLISLFCLIAFTACQKQVDDQLPLKYLANGTWHWSADTINNTDVLTACKADDTLTFLADRTVDQNFGTQLCSDGKSIVSYSVSSGGKTLTLVDFDGNFQNYAINSATDSTFHMSIGTTTSGGTTYEYVTMQKNR